MKLYHDFLDHLNFVGNPADLPEGLENPVKFDDLYFPAAVFDDPRREFLNDLFPTVTLPANALPQFDEILKEHLTSIN